MSEKSDHLPYSLGYWAAESVQEHPDQRALMNGHIVRTHVRFWLFVIALVVVLALSLALEYVRTGAATISGWRWLAGIVPGLIGLVTIWVTSTVFVQDVYDIPDWRAALGYVRLLLLGRAPLSLLDLLPLGMPMFPYPHLIVRDGKIDGEHADTPLARSGGPGNAIIFNDSAVFLERFGRFTRVAGPGRVFLRRFERIREVLDLRPQERSAVAKALTKDGIPVQTEIQVRFQLARPPASLVPPVPDVPHLVYKWALIRAGQCHLRAVNVDSDEEQVVRWPERASGVGGLMRALIAEYRLDELLEPYEPGRDPRREISQRLYDRLQDGARNFGAQILEVRMGALEPTLEEVTQERIASWQSAWRSRSRREETQGMAEAIRERGLARAYAQMEIILGLAREFQDAVEREVAPPAEIVILRFMEALRQTWSRPEGAFVSSQVFKMWQALQKDLQQLAESDHPLPRSEARVNQSH